jgi:uncharacterized coiled-coil DUF342 family protein
MERASWTDDRIEWQMNEIDRRFEQALRLQRAEFTAKIDGVHLAIQGVPGEVQGVRDEIQGLRDEIQGLRDDIQGLRDEMVRQYRHMKVIVAGSAVGLAGVISAGQF